MPAKKTAKAKVSNKFVIDCSKPVDDNLMQTSKFEEFLLERIKVNGKTGVLGNDVSVTHTDGQIIVNTEIAFSKRYLKYLTKKFLKKQQLRDWLHVIASNKNTYELRYFNISEDGDDDEDEDED